MIRQTVNKFLTNKVLVSSGTLFIGMMFVNFTNYLFNIIIARILTPEVFGGNAYGEFFVLNSFTYYFTIPITSLVFISSKIVAEWHAKEEYEKVKKFLITSHKIIFSVSIILGIIGIATAPLIQNFLNIRSIEEVIAMNLGIATSFLFPVAIGTLSGLHKFNWQVTSYIVGNGLRLLLGSLWAFNFGVMGALSGNIAVGIGNSVVSMLVLYMLLRDEKIDKSIKIDFPWKLFITSTISLFAFGSFLSTDVILVKYFLSDQMYLDSNLTIPSVYSMISLFGRIIYFASFTFATVLIPLSSFENEKRGNSTKVLAQIFGLAILVLIPLVAIFFAIPEILINFTYGEEYTIGEKYLGVYSISVAIYALAAIFNNYFISIGKKSQAIIPAIFAITQIVVATQFNDNIEHFIYGLMFVNSLNLVGLGIYYIVTRNNK